jgi:hypothetical protein
MNDRVGEAYWDSRSVSVRYNHKLASRIRVADMSLLGPARAIESEACRLWQQSRIDVNLFGGRVESPTRLRKRKVGIRRRTAVPNRRATLCEGNTTVLSQWTPQLLAPP